MTAPAEDRLSRLVPLLQSLRRRLDQYEALEQPAHEETGAWEIDLYAYDEALVTAADVLEVPVPASARDELTPEHRSAIEAGLAAAGLEVRPGPR